MRPRWAVALVTAILLVLVGATPAAATTPVTLGTSYVLDEAAVLGAAEIDEAEARLERLAADTGLDLWAVFVDRFSSPASPEEWATATADRNGLGPTQYLLAIAVDAGDFYLSGYLPGPLTAQQLGTIEDQRILPALENGDWVGAVTAAADGIEAADAGGSGAPPGTDAGSGGFDAGIVIAVLAVIAIIGVVLYFLLRARRRTKKTSAPPAVTTAELDRRAATALVQADETLRSGEQELGFATAQFGDEATRTLADALIASREDLDRAFAARQGSDDAPGTEEQVRSTHEEVIALSEGVTDRIEQRLADFADLRRLEQDAPAALERLRHERGGIDPALDTAAARTSELGERYAPSALVTVSDNVPQARQRLSYADAQLAEAATAVSSGDNGRAAVALHAAEAAMAQAQGLAAAVGSLDERLRAAAAEIPALAAELDRDIAAAAALPDPDGRLAAAVAAARTEATAVRATERLDDPIATLERLRASDDELDALLQSARDAADRIAHARQLLGPALAQARAELGAAT